jgi:hypothetical protein
MMGKVLRPPAVLEPGGPMLPPPPPRCARVGVGFASSEAPANNRHVIGQRAAETDLLKPCIFWQNIAWQNLTWQSMDKDNISKTFYGWEEGSIVNGANI